MIICAAENANVMTVQNLASPNVGTNTIIDNYMFDYTIPQSYGADTNFYGSGLYLTFEVTLQQDYASKFFFEFPDDFKLKY